MSDETADEPRIQVYRLGQESPIDPHVAKLSMGQRMELAWQITRQTWLMMGQDPDAPFRRDVEHVIRRKS